MIIRAAVLSVVLSLSAHAFAQSDDLDPEIRIQRLETQLRRLTGQNEELTFRNRQLEDQIRQLQSAVPGAAAPRANVAAPPSPAQPAYEPQIAAPLPILQDESPAPAPQQGRRRGDAFDPGRNPEAPGVPRALGGGQLPIPANPTAAPAAPFGAPQSIGAPTSITELTTLPPSASPRDEFDLGIGYIQRRDYALAEETFRNFSQRHPGDALVADSQYWLGESLYQRQRYRDAAEAFLGVTTKFDTSAKAPDALLRLGQSLAALKEKEAACAALGEVTRKYPRAAQGVKQSVDREQKRNKC